MRVVIDTCVLVSAARSRQGASFALVSALPSAKFQSCLSVGLYTEWRDALTRTENRPPGVSNDQVVGFLRYLASKSHLQDIHFLWRPFLSDPDDDMVLELALAAGCQYIITHNVSDFSRSGQLGIQAITPGEFLKLIGE